MTLATTDVKLKGWGGEGGDVNRVNERDGPAVLANSRLHVENMRNLTRNVTTGLESDPPISAALSVLSFLIIRW